MLNLNRLNKLPPKTEREHPLTLSKNSRNPTASQHFGVPERQSAKAVTG